LQIRKYVSREVFFISIAAFVIGFGEELWIRYIPRYLQVLGTPILAIGLFGSVENLLDALYQYPGGILSDRFGYRTAFLLFLALAVGGYLCVFASPPWILVYIGLMGIMAWNSLAFPSIFSVIGSTLPKDRQVFGFTVQSLLKRLPMIISPILGGLLIRKLGIVTSVRGCALVTAILAAGCMLLLRRIEPVMAGKSVKFFEIKSVFRAIPNHLKRLLIADILARIAEGMVDVLVILYVINQLHVPESHYGRFVSIAMLTSTVIYLPVASIAAKFGRKKFVLLTLLFFGLFPVAVVLSKNEVHVAIAFFIAGLREIGEPSRKSMIAGFAPAPLRGSVVGLYYLLRQSCIAPSGFIGAWIYRNNPTLPFWIAGCAGFLAVLYAAIFVHDSVE
jgi:MFS family permease